jgi:hypothetical protein
MIHINARSITGGARVTHTDLPVNLFVVVVVCAPGVTEGQIRLRASRCKHVNLCSCRPDAVSVRNTLKLQSGTSLDKL